jgi:hypothetical protein
MKQVAQVIAVLAMLAGQAAAQEGDSPPLARGDARIAALPVQLYTEQANVQEAGDTAMAALATAVLRSKLAELLGAQLVPEAQVDLAFRPEAERTAGTCGAVVACSRAVAGAVDAEWVVMSKVSKTSNLIWLWTGQLIHVRSGTIVLDDSTELKGEIEAMVRAGSRIFAERVARTVQAGGVANNYPHGVPGSS